MPGLRVGRWWWWGGMRAGGDEVDDFLAASVPGRDRLQVSYEGVLMSFVHAVLLSPVIVTLLLLLVKHPNSILPLPPQKLLQPTHHRAHGLPILPIDRHHGAARGRLRRAGGRRWRRERGRDLGQHFDLVDVGDCHDHCFDAAGVRVGCCGQRGR